MTGFCGCCASLKENQCMLVSYASIVSVILILQIAAGIVVLVYKDQITKKLKLSMYKSLKYKYGFKNDALTKAFDFLQRYLNCCGVESPTDWAESNWFKKTKQIVPLSCCVLTNREKYHQKPHPLDEKKCFYYAEHPLATKAPYYLNTDVAVIAMTCSFRNLLKR